MVRCGTPSTYATPAYKDGSRLGAVRRRNVGSAVVAPCSLFTPGHPRPSDVQQFSLHGLRGSYAVLIWTAARSLLVPERSMRAGSLAACSAHQRSTTLWGYAPDGEQHSIRMLPPYMVDKNCTGPAPKIVVQSREKWPNPSPSIGGMDYQIKRLDEENGESQTACHLLT
jgi:hypothetical protein